MLADLSQCINFLQSFFLVLHSLSGEIMLFAFLARTDVGADVAKLSAN